jgi:glycosyl transferase family 2
MRVLLRSYDLDDPGESAARLRRLGSALTAAGHEVHATSRACGLDDVRAWNPDIIVAQQWATLEADSWGRALRRPLAMLVQGQYETLMPVCDLVAFADASMRAAAGDALGQTPAVLLGDVDAVVESIVAVGSAGRRRPTLALCMTVCNEAATLATAVSSVADIVDEIIIGVDRRSSDDTLAIARRLATDCFEYDESSPPDFPRMRNRALVRARTDWALVLDGHEWIEGADHIRRTIESTMAWSLEVLTLFEPDEQRVPGLSFVFPRIHRRHVRFAGAAAHEELTAPIDRREVHREIRVRH